MTDETLEQVYNEGYQDGSRWAVNTYIPVLLAFVFGLTLGLFW